jgi:hypothetical protein
MVKCTNANAGGAFLGAGPTPGGVSSGVSRVFYFLHPDAWCCRGPSLLNMHGYRRFALWCVLVPKPARWPRAHYESAALAAELQAQYLSPHRILK